VSQETTNRSFDDLARAMAEGSLSRRRALKLFAGTAIAALIPSRALAQQQKVTICHKPGTPDEQTIEVSQSAVNSHLRHGDQLGTCSACPDGRVLLSNGTCVIEFPPNACFCSEPCSCTIEVEQEGHRAFCASAFNLDARCPRGHIDCPEGQFCTETGLGTNPVVCAVAC
jgi:hypothetical protein